MTAKKQPAKLSARQLKKRIQQVIDQHRSIAFEECVNFVARENPRGRAYSRWFDAAWLESIKRPGE